jgi:crotonobetainyl-CoA:carnitine CoA-transferase CaiB-like acyl-CoA transferase
VVGGANQTNWLRLLDALQAPELARDARFVTNADRMAHLDELSQELGRRFRTRPAAYWLGKLEQAGLPCGPVYDMLQALAHAQTFARQMVVEVEHAAEGRVKALGLPVKFSDTPGKVRTGAPLYGQHTREVLREHGFTEDEISALQSEGAVIAAEAPEGVG